MKLKCLIGSLSCDGILAEKGDVFEIGDEAGNHIVSCGYAVLVPEEKTPDKPKRQNRK